MTRLAWSLTLLLALLRCSGEQDPDADAETRNAQLATPPRREVRIAAAKDLARLYAESPLQDWQVKAVAAGPDCGVLVVETPVVMERTMVDAMHYGHGSYRISERSIDDLYRARGFRGVLYKDGSSRLWVYGETGSGTLTPCS